MIALKLVLRLPASGGRSDRARNAQPQGGAVAGDQKFATEKKVRRLMPGNDGSFSNRPKTPSEISP